MIFYDGFLLLFCHFFFRLDAHDFLLKRNEIKSVEKYLKSVSDKKSKIWKLAKSSRQSALEEIYICALKANMNSHFLSYIQEWGRWFGISYLGDREDILNDLLEWIDLLFDKNHEKWRKVANVILAVSKYIREVGSDDIGVGFQVSISIAALKEGIPSLWQFFENCIFCRGEEAAWILCRVATLVIPQDLIKKEDIIDLWNLIYQYFDIGNITDREKLFKLKESIKKYLEEQNDIDIMKECIDIEKVKMYNFQTNEVKEVGDGFTVLSFEEMLSYLKIKFDKGQSPWDECCTFIKKLKEYRPHNICFFIDAIIKLLIEKHNVSQWRGFGVNDVYKELFSIIAESDKWFVIKSITEKLEQVDDFTRWLRYIGESLFYICLYHGQEMDLDEIENNVSTIIDMHIRLLSGNYRYNYIDYEEIKPQINYPNNWKEFAEVFSEHFEIC